MNKISKENLTKTQALACSLMAEGYSENDIVIAIFGMTKEEDKEGFLKKRALIRRWSKDPKFTELYKETIRAIAMPSYGKALRKMNEQVDHENPFVAQNAARDILTRYNSALFGEDKSDLVIRIEGMPDLGTPDDND